MRANRHTARLLLRDVRETADFVRARGTRHAARRELSQCYAPEDYFRFTHRRFVRGAAQNGNEIAAFARHAAAIAPKTVCEIGVQDGGTNFVLSRALHSVETMIAIDLYVSLKSQLRFFRRPDLNLEIVERSSHSSAALKRVRRILGSRPIDVLFIDGDHSYAGALKDFMLYKPLVRSGGLIAFHDIVPDFFTRHGIRTEAFAGDVPKLWEQLSPLYQSVEFVESRDQDGRGIGVLVHDPAVEVGDIFGL